MCGVKTVGGQTKFRSESRQYIPNGTKKSPAFRKDICLKSSCKSVSLVTASFCHIERLRQYKQIQEHVWRQIYCQNRRRYWEVVNGDRKRRNNPLHLLISKKLRQKHHPKTTENTDAEQKPSTVTQRGRTATIASTFWYRKNYTGPHRQMIISRHWEIMSANREETNRTRRPHSSPSARAHRLRRW